MKKRILAAVTAIAVTTVGVIPVYADTLDNVAEALSSLDGSGGYFSIYEFSPYEGEKILQIIETVDMDADDESRNNFIYGCTDAYIEMSKQDWFDYDYLYVHTFIEGKEKPSNTSIYDFKNDTQDVASWEAGMYVYNISDEEMLKKTSVLEDVQGTVEENDSSSGGETPDLESATLGQQNALKSAESYLSMMAFSYSGLIDQLEYEGYTNEEATYAADNCGADWNEQAAKSAKNYLEIMSFSRDGLVQQLEYEGFTAEQAEYGVAAVGY